jgi:NTE family protein
MGVGDERLIIGVFKGGGAKGALYAGALEAVQQHGLWFSEVAGSSAGAITAAFVAAGATPNDLRTLEKTGRTLLAFPSVATSALNLRNAGGILSFEALRDWLAKSLNDLCVSRLDVAGFGEGGPTFEQLAQASRIPLHIAGADLLWRAPVVFNAALTPELPVADAAAASSSIPFIFEAPELRDATGGTSTQILVSDGGVMANLPLFVFSDDGYRSVAGLGPRRAERVVGFTFVDRETPRHAGQSGVPGEEYRRRFAPRSRATTFCGELSARLLQAGLRDSLVRHVHPARPKSARRWSPLAPLLWLIGAALRGVEVVVLPPLNALLSLMALRGYRPYDLPVANPRARRWVRFGERVFGLAPAYVVAGVLLVVPVLVFGIPSVVAFLWPGWPAVTGDGGIFSRVMLVLLTLFVYLLIVVGCLLVVVLTAFGIATYLVGWVAKPVALSMGPHLVSTFLQNPQEPAWAGAGGDEVIIRIRVPAGWNALRSTTDDDEMAAALEGTRVWVSEQLERAGLGRSPDPPGG